MSTGQLQSAPREFRLLADVPTNWNAADLQQHLGGIPLQRICLVPPPGCASEDDVIRLHDDEHRLCERQDGVLVEKTMGWSESILASEIVIELGIFLRSHSLGKVLGPDGTLRFLPGLVKIPDVSFVSWQRWPKQTPPRRTKPVLSVQRELIFSRLLSVTSCPKCRSSCAPALISRCRFSRRTIERLRRFRNVGEKCLKCRPFGLF